jgi:hypothetical protein
MYTPCADKAIRAIRWIEKYCTSPDTPDGERRPVRLSEAEEAEIWKLYINDGLVFGAPISGPLASYLALLHVCGPEALSGGPLPPVEVDPWTVWRAASPDLRRILKRDGAAIVSPRLAKRYPNTGGVTNP